MRLLDKVTIDLKDDEGFRSKPYHDTVGVLTIGYGRNLDHRGITMHEASIMLENDVTEVHKQLEKRLPNFNKYPFQVQRGLINMGFQMGVDGLLQFKNTIKLLDEGKYTEAGNNALRSKWAQQTPHRAQRVVKMLKNIGD